VRGRERGKGFARQLRLQGGESTRHVARADEEEGKGTATHHPADSTPASEAQVEESAETGRSIGGCVDAERSEVEVDVGHVVGLREEKE
jgi:hypothetical protein